MIVYKDTVGEPQRPPGPQLSALGLPSALSQALFDLYGDDIHLTPPQEWACNHGLLSGSGDYLVCTPTNSGKTLVGVLKVFHDALQHNVRSIYVVPLKALAEEKFTEFTAVADGITRHGGPIVKVTITTGDYQLTEDFLGSPPPDDGQVVICTPERLEVMLRNSSNHCWAMKVGSYVIDEFHLLGDQRRGGTVESLITRIFTLGGTSQIIGLSATIGNLEDIRSWFAANGRDVNATVLGFRYPRLHRTIQVIDDRDDFVVRTAQAVAGNPTRGMLVFAYTKKDTEKLADLLRKTIDPPEIVSCFHAGLTMERRKAIADAVRSRAIRIVTATTSLKMGVNFPVTDVIIRDATWEGYKKLAVADVLQMMGRAGRGDITGKSVLLCKAESEAGYYRTALASGFIEDVQPQLCPRATSDFRGKKGKGQLTVSVNPLAAMVLTELSIREEARLPEIEEFLNRSFSAHQKTFQTDAILEVVNLLEDGKVAFRKEESEETYLPTKLGRTVSMTGLSPESGAILAGFLRALINLSEKEREQGQNKPNFLGRLRPLDLIFLSLAAYESRPHWTGKPSSRAILQVQEYIESLPPEEKPLVNLWRSDDSDRFPTRRLLATLRVERGPSQKATELIFYRILQTAILIHRHSRGEKLDVLAKEYKTSEGQLEGGLKFTILWVLNTLAQICDPAKCYKLNSLRMIILEMIDNVSLGASLGKLLTIEGVGKRTVYRLMDHGIRDIYQLENVTKEKLENWGIAKQKITAILTRVRREYR